MLRYGISGLLFIGAILIGVFYLKPAWDQFLQIRAETEHVRELSTEFDLLIQNRDALVAKLNLVSRDDLRKLEALIPQGVQSLEYLIALQQLAQESGVGLTFTKADINPPASSAATGQAPLPAATGAATPGTGTPRAPQMLNPSKQATPQTISVKDLPVGIDISASYETLKRFITRLERFGRLTDITALNVAQSGGEGQQAEASEAFKFSLSLITHYQ